MPRTGGIGLHAGILLAWLLLSPNLPATVGAAFLALLGVSMLDDVGGLSVVVRLVAHVVAAGAVAWEMVTPGFGWPAAMVVALAVAWMINLYNFMDGSDGLAGGMALFGFSFYGIAAWLSGSTEFAMLNLSVAAAAAGFLAFNFHPARIFMGDVGSVPLGFLAASFGLVGWLQRDWPWWFPLLVFSPFIVDASVTLARRLLSREKVWEAHRDHYYQRLVQLGWGHGLTALVEYALMGACGIAGLLALAGSDTATTTVVTVLAVLYAVMLGAIELAWHRRQAPVK